MYAQLIFDGYPTVGWIATNEGEARMEANRLVSQRQADGILYLSWSIDRNITYRKPARRKAIEKAIADNYNARQWRELPATSRADYCEAYADEYNLSYSSVFEIFNRILGVVNTCTV